MAYEMKPLAWSQRDRKLLNTWAADHTGNLAGASAKLAMLKGN